MPVSLTLSWWPSSDTTRYNVFFGTVGNATVVATPLTTSHSISGLSHSTTYEWWIEAVGPGGSTASNSRTFTTVPAGGSPVDPEEGGPSRPELPTSRVSKRSSVIIQKRADRYDTRFRDPTEGLMVDEFTTPDGLPNTYAIDPNVSGYLVRVVVVPDGTDSQWSLTIKDAWGGVILSDDTLNMNDGVVSFDGQRIPFVDGLFVTVAGTTAETADKISFRFYIQEWFTK